MSFNQLPYESLTLPPFKDLGHVPLSSVEPIEDLATRYGRIRNGEREFQASVLGDSVNLAFGAENPPVTELYEAFDGVLHQAEPHLGEIPEHDVLAMIFSYRSGTVEPAQHLGYPGWHRDDAAPGLRGVTYKTGLPTRVAAATDGLPEGFDEALKIAHKRDVQDMRGHMYLGQPKERSHYPRTDRAVTVMAADGLVEITAAESGHLMGIDDRHLHESPQNNTGEPVECVFFRVLRIPRALEDEQ